MRDPFLAVVNQVDDSEDFNELIDLRADNGAKMKFSSLSLCVPGPLSCKHTVAAITLKEAFLDLRLVFQVLFNCIKISKQHGCETKHSTSFVQSQAHGHPQKVFQVEVQSRHFAYRYQVVDDATQIDIHKSLHPFYTTKKVPNVMATVTYSVFPSRNFTLGKDLF